MLLKRKEARRKNMVNFFETLVNVLRADERFFTEDDGTLLRNKVYESALNMDENLIGLLLSNDETKPAKKSQ